MKVNKMHELMLSCVSELESADAILRRVYERLAREQHASCHLLARYLDSTRQTLNVVHEHAQRVLKVHGHLLEAEGSTRNEKTREKKRSTQEA